MNFKSLVQAVQLLQAFEIDAIFRYILYVFKPFNRVSDTTNQHPLP